MPVCMSPMRKGPFAKQPAIHCSMQQLMLLLARHTGDLRCLVLCINKCHADDVQMACLSVCTSTLLWSSLDLVMASNWLNFGEKQPGLWFKGCNGVVGSSKCSNCI